MADKQIKRYSVSLVIGKMQIKTTMRKHHILPRMAKIKHTDHASGGRMWRNWDPHALLVRGKSNGTTTLENSLATS